MVRGSTDTGRRQCCTRNTLCGLSVFLAVCLTISLLCLAVSLYCIFIHFKVSGSSTCTEAPCIASSAEIGEFVDDSVDPCEDFHAFVCDKFTKTAYEKQINNPLKAEHDRLETKINNFVIEPEFEDDVPPVVMQKRYFQACLKEEDLDKNNNSIFFSLMNEIGGWPLLKSGKWRQDYFDWMRVMIRTRQIGLPFDWFLDIDVHEGRYFKISKPKSCDALENKLSSEYNDMMGRIIQNLTDSKTESFMQFGAISDFEKELAVICAKVKNQSTTVAPIIILERIWPGGMMDCRKFIRDISGQITKWELETEVAYDRDYIIRLNDLLKNTPKETQANYIGWKIMEYFAPFLSKSIRENYQKHIEKQTGTKFSRFDFCLEDTKSKFHLVSETMFIQKYAIPEIREAGQDIVNAIKDEMSNHIDNIQWMNNATKRIYSDIFQKMQIVIGGPEETFEQDVFTKYLQIGQLRFSSPNIIHMIIEWSRNLFFTKMEMIKNPTPQSPFTSYVDLTNGLKLGVYSNHGRSKTIFVPIINLYGTTYNIERPQYLNYASLGTLTAMKLVENALFQDENTEQSYYGNFERNQQCLIKSLQTSDNELNASLLARNVYIDLVSRNVVYKAYQKYVEENGEEAQLPGLDYTPNQLFWIKSSINWCYQDLPNEASHPDVYQLYKHRIIETAKNSPAFSEDFECEERAPMNSMKKCQVI